MFGRKTYHVFLIFLLFFCFTNNAQDRPINQRTPVEVIGDFHRQDNIRYATGYNKLDWYGSGDVNNDEKIDSLDVAAMDTTSSYRADVDGDGTPGTANDEMKLKNFLTGVSDYLPGHWDKLQTPEERVSWLEKMIPIERKIREGQSYTQSDDAWIRLQSFINFNGISDISGYIQFEKDIVGTWVTLDSTANGLFNIPVRVLGLKNDGEVYKSNNLQILDKDDPLDVTNYFSFNPIAGDKVTLEEKLNYDRIYVGSSFKWGNGDGDFNNDNFVHFVIENNEQKEISYMRAFVLRNSPRKSSINLTAPEDVTIDKTIYENNPDLLSDFYGSLSVTSTPPEGQDFYWVGYIDGIHDNLIKGEIKNEIKKSIVDTTYLNPDSTIFTVKKKFVGTESEIDSAGRKDLGFYREYRHLLDKDSVYQNITVDLTVGVPRENGLEKKFSVSQNYPNPFNPTTTIKFTIPVVETTRRVVLTKLIVYDALGREVKTLINESLAPGAYEVKFNGSELPSGVYFYRLTTGSRTQTRKMMLLK